MIVQQVRLDYLIVDHLMAIFLHAPNVHPVEVFAFFRAPQERERPIAEQLIHMMLFKVFARFSDDAVRQLSHQRLFFFDELLLKVIVILFEVFSGLLLEAPR